MKFRSPVTKLKRTIGKKTGIPTTKSGRSRKVNRVTGGVSGALSSLGNSPKSGRKISTRVSGSQQENGIGVVALIVACISGYFFGWITGLVVFFVSVIGFSILIAKNSANKVGAVPAREYETATTRFFPTDPAFEPINLSFTLHEPPKETASAPGGSYSMEPEKYQLDLGQAQCSCKGWGNREQYPIGDPRRLCRHLVYAFRERKLIQGNDEWSQAIIDNCEDIPLQSWRVRLHSAPDALVTRGDSAEWLNVFARRKENGERISEASGPITRYGWSVVESRWSYGESVPGAREINKLLHGARRP
jgi:hypothetical protein